MGASAAPGARSKNSLGSANPRCRSCFIDYSSGGGWWADVGWGGVRGRQIKFCGLSENTKQCLDSPWHVLAPLFYFFFFFFLFGFIFFWVLSLLFLFVSLLLALPSHRPGSGRCGSEGKNNWKSRNEPTDFLLFHGLWRLFPWIWNISNNYIEQKLMSWIYICCFSSHLQK